MSSSNPLDAATLRAVMEKWDALMAAGEERSQTEEEVEFDGWLRGLTLHAEAAAPRPVAEQNDKGWLHGPDCPYAPYADSGEDAPEGVGCICGENALAARWKARVVLLRGENRTLTAQVQALSGGCGCIYGGPGIGMDTECAVHRQERERLEAQMQALTEERDKLKSDVAFLEAFADPPGLNGEPSTRDRLRTERDQAWQQAIAVVGQIAIGHFHREAVLAALRAASAKETGQ